MEKYILSHVVTFQKAVNVSSSSTKKALFKKKYIIIIKFLSF